MDILIATKNQGKFKEIKSMLLGLEADFVSLADLGITDDFVEDGESFEENSLGKAQFYAEKSGLITVADDSGIFVKALSGEMGVKTRRWGAGESATDEEWLNFFMDRMSAEKNREAKFVCCATIVVPKNKPVMIKKTFIGESFGTISEQIEAPVKEGVPLSSVFRPDGEELVYSALSVQNKNRLSHRGKAFLQLLNYAKEYFTKN